MKRFLSCCIFFFLTSYCDASKNASIVIVGAGAAGIAAASKLLENSFINVVIFEAQDRIGGRIHTTTFEDKVIDMGAQFCHGEKGNIVYDLVKDLDLLESSVGGAEFVKFYSSTGEIVPPSLASDVENFMFKYESKITKSENCTLGAAIKKAYNETIYKKYNDENTLKLAKDAMRAIEAGVTGYEGAYSWDLLPIGSNFVNSEGDLGLSWKTHGYRIILDILMKSYPDPSKKLPIDNKLHLNKKVEKIIWNGDVATIHTSDNSSTTADHVIFTPSIGVLKDKIDSMFVPKLPQNKYEALESIGFDAIMKIFLHFPEKWWNNDVSSFSLIWLEEDLVNFTKQFPEAPQKDGISWIASISNIMKLNNNYDILELWVSGELIPQIENMPEDLLLRQCNQYIKTFFHKDYNVTSADKLMRTKWKSNPNFRGTYSYEKFGHFKRNVSHHAKLAEPQYNTKGNPILLFAGEGTNPDHFSVVHGAIETGIREAKRIINLYK